MTAGTQSQPQGRLRTFFDRALLNSGVPLVVGSGLLFSFSALLIKATGSYLPVLEICFIRSSISVVLTVAWGSWLGGFPLYGHRKNWPTLAARGVFGTLSVTSAFASYVLLPLGDAATVSQLRQPVSAVVARLLLGEHLGLQGALGGLVSMAGVVVVAHPPFLFGGIHWSSSRLLGMALGVNFCLFSAGVAMTIRRIGRSEHTLTIALWFHTSIVVFTGIALVAGWPQAPLVPRHQDILPLAGIVLTTYLAQLGMTRALQITPVATVAALAFLGVIWGHVLGAAFLGETITPGGALGAVLIFTGVLLVALRRTPPGTSSSSSSRRDAAAPTAASCTAYSSLSSQEEAPGTPQQQLLLLQQQQQQQQQQQLAVFSIEDAGAAQDQAGAPVGLHHQQQQQQKRVAGASPQSPHKQQQQLWDEGVQLQGLPWTTPQHTQQHLQQDQEEEGHRLLDVHPGSRTPTPFPCPDQRSPHSSWQPQDQHPAPAGAGQQRHDLHQGTQQPWQPAQHQHHQQQQLLPWQSDEGRGGAPLPPTQLVLEEERWVHQMGEGHLGQLQHRSPRQQG